LDEGFGLIVFAAVMYGYVPWLLLQFPLGVLVYLYGLRLEVSAGSERSTSLQFGLRQLMVITACLAIILAGGRVGLPWLTSSLGSLMELSTVAFVYIACLTTALLTFLAMLLPRYALPGVVGVLLLIGVFTLAEPLLFAQIQESADPDMTLSLFAMLNGILVSWTLLIGGLLRWAGYRWATRPGIH
jgi:hypothetical protein